MLFRILHIAMFVLIIWLTFQLSQTNAQVNSLQNLTKSQQKMLDTTLVAAQKGSEEKLDTLTEQMTSIVEAQKKSADGAKKLKAFKAKQEKVDTLRKAYILVLEAEAARIAQNGKGAQEKLNASKKLVWKSGSNFADHKKALQGLMKHIDSRLRSWKAGDLKKDTKEIYSVIEKVIKKQAN